MTEDTRVLLAVDGSEFSLRAARSGLDLLGGSTVPTVLMVVRPPVPLVPVADAAPPIDPAVAEGITEDELANAHAEVATVVRSLGVDAEPRLECGDPGSTICEVAATGAFDVIVVGSHGTGWMKRLLVGSVSHHVVQHAPCPVLVVRTGPPDAGS